MLEQPGPPLNHVARGAVVGFERASKLSLILEGVVLDQGTRLTTKTTYSHWVQQRDSLNID